MTRNAKGSILTHDMSILGFPLLSMWMRGAFPMKKAYKAPELECLTFCSLTPIGAEEQAESLFNDGTLDWGNWGNLTP